MELTLEKIQEYKKVKEFLDEVCEKYFTATAPDWRYYGDGSFLIIIPIVLLFIIHIMIGEISMKVGMKLFQWMF